MKQLIDVLEKHCHDFLKHGEEMHDVPIRYVEMAHLLTDVIRVLEGETPVDELTEFGAHACNAPKEFYASCVDDETFIVKKECLAASLLNAYELGRTSR